MMKHRKPNRLPDFDYSRPGFYFVTICTKNMREYFGSIYVNELIPSAAGLVVDWHWRRILRHHKHVCLDVFQVMPNHIHGIIEIDEVHRSIFTRRQDMLIPQIISRFKMQTAKQIRAEINSEFQWQRSYYDHVIRSAESLEKIRAYILTNPENWERDHNRIDDNPFS
ncbi:MAG: transposase [Candidatus Marinimicrobia bacterium]|nr:transposase [Candidatus Neomarinimicrobiota bacterium]